MRKWLACLTAFGLIFGITGWIPVAQAEQPAVANPERYTIYRNVEESWLSSPAKPRQSQIYPGVFTLNVHGLSGMRWRGPEVVCGKEQAREYLFITGRKVRSTHYYREAPDSVEKEVAFTLTEFVIDRVLEQGIDTSGYQKGSVITVAETYAFNEKEERISTSWGLWSFPPMREGIQYVLILEKSYLDGVKVKWCDEIPDGVWLARSVNVLDEQTITWRTEKLCLNEQKRLNLGDGSGLYAGDYTLLPEILNTYFPQEAS